MPCHKNSRIKPATKPTVFTLLVHIVTSAFTGGIFLVLVSGGALVAFLYYNSFPPDNLLALLLGTIVMMSFYRGCVAWQQDLDEYRKHVSYMRRTHESKHEEHLT